MNVEFKEDGRFLQLYFSCPPDEKTRETLKLCGWKWFFKKGCWSNIRNDETMEFAKSMCKLNNPDKDDDSELEHLPRQCFDEVNVVVRSNSFFCNAKHKLVDMAGEFDVCDNSGNIRTYIAPIVFCASCGTYYILESVYKDITRKGIILCQIIEYNTFVKHGAFNSNDGFWEAESPLKIMGYTVNKESDYSETQRHAVLERIVDKGILTKDAVISYLDFFIRMHADKEDAISKWKSDKRYITDYKLLSQNRKHIKGVTYYIKVG